MEQDKQEGMAHNRVKSNDFHYFDAKLRKKTVIPVYKVIMSFLLRYFLKFSDV